MIFQNYFLLLNHAQLMIFSLLWFGIFLLVIFQITIVKGVTVAKLQYFKFSVICLTKRLNLKTILMSNQLMMQQQLHAQLMWKRHMTLLCQRLLHGALDLKDRIWFDLVAKTSTIFIIAFQRKYHDAKIGRFHHFDCGSTHACCGHNCRRGIKVSPFFRPDILQKWHIWEKIWLCNFDYFY